MQKLTKKQRKLVSRQIRAKLDRMGIENKLQIVPSGKRVRILELDAKGQPQVGTDGKFKTIVVDRMIGKNVYKNTVRTVRNLPLNRIEAFLNAPEPKK